MKPTRLFIMFTALITMIFAAENIKVNEQIDNSVTENNEIIATAGCTNPDAFNYDSYATDDDGSCILDACPEYDLCEGSSCNYWVYIGGFYSGDVGEGYNFLMNNLGCECPELSSTGDYGDCESMDFADDGTFCASSLLDNGICNSVDDELNCVEFPWGSDHLNLVEDIDSFDSCSEIANTQNLSFNGCYNHLHHVPIPMHHGHNYHMYLPCQQLGW